jgi:hypothetical protein
MQGHAASAITAPTKGAFAIQSSIQACQQIKVAARISQCARYDLLTGAVKARFSRLEGFCERYVEGPAWRFPAGG